MENSEENNDSEPAKKTTNTEPASPENPSSDSVENIVNKINQNPTETPAPKKKSNKKLYITLILLIVIIFGGYGIFKMTGDTISENIDNTIQDESSTQASEINLAETAISGEDTSEKLSGVLDKVRLQTTMGNIIINLYDNMPITSGNFKNLVEQGLYDGVVFHRVIPGFMIQGGDPTGTGMGDSSIPSIQDEFIEGHSNIRGTISMANAGPNTGSSQFFINLIDNTFLDFDKPPETSKHPVFGEVVEGMDVVDRISQVPRDARDKPQNHVRIIKAEIV